MPESQNDGGPSAHDRPLAPRRVDEILELFGLNDRPSTDPTGLHALYSAWCRSVPFDNLAKLVALHANADALPGIRAVDFFSAWQADGVGGTCWSTNNALYALLRELGFNASTWSASMFDGPPNHGTTIVTIDETRWIVDTAIHGDKPAPIIDGETTTVCHAGYPTTVRHDPKGTILEHPTPDPTFVVPCRIIEPIGYPETIGASERSRAWSPFNSKLMAAINDDDGVWMLNDTTLTRITNSDRDSCTLNNQEIDEFLIDIVGCTSKIVATVRATL